MASNKRVAASTQNLRLRNVSEDDLSVFFEHQRDPEANRMAAFPARSWDAFSAHWYKILSDETVMVRTILVGEQVAGNVLSWEQDGKRLVGYWIGKKHWSKGIASQSLSKYLHVVTNRPLYAYVAQHNVASIRVLEKCGFAICIEETDSLGEPHDGVPEFVYWLR